MVAYASSPGIEGYPLTGGSVPWEPAFRKGTVLLDFPAIAKARAAAGLLPLAAGDTLDLFKIPPASKLFDMHLQVITPGVALTTVTLKNGVGGATLAASLSIAAAGWGHMAPASGTFATVADTLQLVLDTAGFANAKIGIMFVLLDCAI